MFSSGGSNRGAEDEASSDERVSRTVLKPRTGFRAELPGLDLATLIQMTCARRERLVVRVASYDEEGFIFSADGHVVHATLGALTGAEAVLQMLSWTSGEFTLCERPFPARPSIESSTESLLLRAAQRSDEAARLRPDLAAAIAGTDDDSDESPTLPPPPPALRRSRAALVPPSHEPTRDVTRSNQPPHDVTRNNQPPRPPLRSGEPLLKIPPPPPPTSRKLYVRGEPLTDSALIASVRVDGKGEVVGSYGGSDLLPQLIAYVSRLIALLRVDFSLDPFEALHVELSDARIMVFEDAGELVGLMLRPGSTVQALRQRLGV